MAAKRQPIPIANQSTGLALRQDIRHARLLKGPLEAFVAPVGRLLKLLDQNGDHTKNERSAEIQPEIHLNLGKQKKLSQEHGMLKIS